LAEYFPVDTVTSVRLALGGGLLVKAVLTRVG